jgi:hypothetical protein
MVGATRAVREFAREALRSEFLTPAGVINLIGLFAVFVLLLAAEATGAWEALVRTLDSSYRAGGPSFFWLLLTFVGTLLACVLIVGLLTRPKD